MQAHAEVPATPRRESRQSRETVEQFPTWGPICCQRPMREMIRRAIVRSDGSMILCCVWNCGRCGKLLL